MARMGQLSDSQGANARTRDGKRGASIGLRATGARDTNQSPRGGAARRALRSPRSTRDVTVPLQLCPSPKGAIMYNLIPVVLEIGFRVTVIVLLALILRKLGK